MPNIKAWLTGIIGALGLGLLLFYGQRYLSPEPVYKLDRTVRYGYTVSNTANTVLNDAEFWVYAPVKQTATQKVVNLTASIPFDLKEDALGNQVMHFRLPTLAPYAAKVISITAELKLAAQPNAGFAPDNGQFTQAERYIESEAPDIKAKATELLSDQNHEKALFEWVGQHIQFSRYVREDLGALHALQQQQGDCTESAYLFTALARAAGRPSRALGGFVHEHNAVLKAEDYHNWAEYYDGHTWRLSDPQNKVFDQNYASYIAMRIITQAENSLLDSSHRFAYSGPSLHIAMN